MFNNQSSSVVDRQSIHEKTLKVSYRKDFGVFLTNNILTVDEILEFIAKTNGTKKKYSKKD